MELPDEIVEEIVRRLPGESMLQFRVVSKSWRRMIDSFKFQPRAILLHRDASRAFQSSNDNYTNDNVFEELKTPFPTTTTARVKIKGSVNGLLLLAVHGYESRFSYSLFIWNPFTGYMTNVPTKLDPDLYWLEEGVGFSYNPHTDDYTVVLAGNEYWNGVGDYREDSSHVMAASLKTMEWKGVRFDSYRTASIRDDDGAVVEGHLHWRVKKREVVSEPYKTIVYFDAITNEFQEVPLPELGENVTIERLCVLGGCLCIICFPMRDYYDKTLPLHCGAGEIKAMTKYGDGESWTTLISLSRSNIHSWISFFPLCFTTNGEEVLIQVYKHNVEIVAYNLKSESARTIDISNIQSLYLRCIVSVTSFEPTLIKPILGDRKRKRIKDEK